QVAKLKEALPLLREYVKRWPGDPDQEKLIKGIEARDAFAQGMRALDVNQLQTAEVWFARAEQLDPALKSSIDSKLQGVKGRNDYRAKVDAGDQALAAGDFVLAVNLWGVAINMTTDTAEKDRLQEKIRTTRLRQSLGKASDAMTATKWDEAEAAFNSARRFLKPGDDAAGAAIDARIEEIRVHKTFEKMLKDGDDLMARSKYTEARKQYQSLLEYAKDLKNAGNPAPIAPPRNPRAPVVIAPATPQLPKVPVSLITEIETVATARIKDCDYARYVYDARVDMEQKKWETAKLFAEMARRAKDTPEVKAILQEIENATAPPKPAGTGT
ncbi:MAG: hypothetical protein PHU85_13900, partial [Phycisphaerae bacterium]|nr:hypothetical protein [Phycisphaerae bacterium]